MADHPIEPVIPQENWFNLNTAEPTFRNGLLTTIVKFTNNQLPESEIGNRNYYAHVQPYSVSGFPMFSALTYFTASFGNGLETVVETRNLPEIPNYVYVTIQKDVPDIPFATPYASNRLTHVPVITAEPEPIPEPKIPDPDLELRVSEIEAKLQAIKEIL